MSSYTRERGKKKKEKDVSDFIKSLLLSFYYLLQYRACEKLARRYFAIVAVVAFIADECPTSSHTCAYINDISAA